LPPPKALRQGRRPYRAHGRFRHVANSRYQRAVGYNNPNAVKIFTPQGATKPVYAPYTEHHPPDIGAIKTWLFNRDPNRWKESSRQVDIRARIEAKIEQMSPEQRYARLTELLVKAGVLELEPRADRGRVRGIDGPRLRGMKHFPIATWLTSLTRSSRRSPNSSRAERERQVSDRSADDGCSIGGGGRAPVPAIPTFRVDNPETRAEIDDLVDYVETFK
jgi:hypothetical protein